MVFLDSVLSASLYLSSAQVSTKGSPHKHTHTHTGWLCQVYFVRNLMCVCVCVLPQPDRQCKVVNATLWCRTLEKYCKTSISDDAISQSVSQSIPAPAGRGRRRARVSNGTMQLESAKAKSFISFFFKNYTCNQATVAGLSGRSFIHCLHSSSTQLNTDNTSTARMFLTRFLRWPLQPFAPTSTLI